MRFFTASRRARLAALGAVVAGVVIGTASSVAAASAAAVPPVPRNRTVVVWGDSLAWEAGAYITFLGAANGMPTEVRSFGGTATCDWFRDMRAYLPVARPAVVGLAFSGDKLTPRMRPAGGDPLGQKPPAKNEGGTAAGPPPARPR